MWFSLLFLPLFSSYYLTFHLNGTTERLIADERDDNVNQLIHSALREENLQENSRLTSFFQDNDHTNQTNSLNSLSLSLYQLCQEKMFHVETGDGLYHTEGYLILSTYHLEQTKGKRCAGPDWTFLNWPMAKVESFHVAISQILDASQHTPHIHKVGWYGNVKSPGDETLEYKTRPMLLELTAKYPHLFHFQHVCQTDECLERDFVSFSELVGNFTYLLDIGGNGYSGRLKYLLFSNRPIFLVERPYVEYYHEDLVPYSHYIPVHANLSNFVDQVLWARTHPLECKQIASNALAFAKINFTTQKLYQRYQNVIIDQCRHGPCFELQ